MERADATVADAAPLEPIYAISEEARALREALSVDVPSHEASLSALESPQYPDPQTDGATLPEARGDEQKLIAGQRGQVDEGCDLETPQRQGGTARQSEALQNLAAICSPGGEALGSSETGGREGPAGQPRSRRPPSRLVGHAFLGNHQQNGYPRGGDGPAARIPVHLGKPLTFDTFAAMRSQELSEIVRVQGAGSAVESTERSKSTASPVMMRSGMECDTRAHLVQTPNMRLRLSIKQAEEYSRDESQMVCASMLSTMITALHS